MSMAMCLMDSFLGKMYIDENGKPFYLYKGKEVKRILAFHDEYSWECHPDIAEEISKKTVECIVKAGEFFKDAGCFRWGRKDWKDLVRCSLNFNKTLDNI